MATALGKIETQFFAYVQMRRLQTVRTGELLRVLGITPQQERELLSRLARRSLIARVRRGLYLVPPRLPPGGKWSPSEFLALTALIEDRGGQYQVCGPSAFYHYGWDNQIPNRLYAYNNRITGERTIGCVANNHHQAGRRKAGRDRGRKNARWYRRSLLLAGPFSGGRRV